MTLQLILVIIGALVAQFGVFKLQKFFNDRKVKDLNDDLYEKTKEIELLKKEKEVRIREQKAGIAHRERVVLTKKETKKIESQIDKAHTPDEIEFIINMIDEDNNFRVR